LNGKDGAPGQDGLTGKDGAPGQTGLQGPKGDKGDVGERGANGVEGPQGLVGNTGAAGSNGAPGAKGDTGPQGVPGPEGNTGGVGPQGESGAQGLGVFDSSGVPQFLGYDSHRGLLFTTISGSQKYTQIDLDTGALVGKVPYFSTSNCTGVVYVQAESGNPGLKYVWRLDILGTNYVQTGNSIAKTVKTTWSFLNSGSVCVNNSNNVVDKLRVVATSTILASDIPFTLPVTVPLTYSN
ncbi:MAG: hypothetical protein ACRD32_00470, partial [Nitrososphaerales archaeon]